MPLQDSEMPSADRRLVFGALITIQVLFGINYVVSKVVVDALPPLAWASVRMTIAAIVMMSVAFLSGRPSPKGKQFFLPLIWLALLGMIINQACFLTGLHYTTSTNAAILNTLIPVFTLAIVIARGQEPLTRNKVFGFISAFSGVLLLRHVEDFSLSDRTLVGDVLMIGNAISISFFMALGGKFLSSYDRLWTSAWLFVYGSVGLGILAIPQWLNFNVPLSMIEPELVICMVFAVFGGTLFTYFLNNWTLSYTKASNVAIYIYLQPALASFLAWMFLGEEMTSRTFMSMGLIFLGMALAMNHLPFISSRR